MSVPARTVEQAQPSQPRQPSVRRARTTAARPPHPSPPHRERARRGSPFAFWILVAVVAGALVLAIASISALLVQASFQIDDLRGSVASLEQQHEVLREQVAADSSPQRVMQWARERGMQMPDRIVIVHLPSGEGAG